MYFYHPLVTSDKLGACAQSALRQTAHHSLSTLSDLTLACDDRLIFATNFLHLFTKKKMACLFLNGGKGQEWGKCVCMVHGKFLHCLQLQSHSKTAQSPSFLLRSGTESSRYLMTGRVATQKGAGGEITLIKKINLL